MPVMTETEANGGAWTRRTAWVRTIRLRCGIRQYRDRQRRGAVRGDRGRVGVGEHRARVVCGFWDTPLSIRVGDWELSQNLRLWVNNGLMTFFFFVSGWRPGASSTWGSCGTGGGSRCRCWRVSWHGRTGRIYLLFNAGEPTAHGWGAAMSTDTAFALGMITLVAAGPPRGCGRSC